MTPGRVTDDQKRALAGNPADPLALQRLGIRLCEAGDWAAALRLLLRAARLHGDIAVLNGQIQRMTALALNRALVHVNAGRMEDAAAILDPLAAVVVPQGDFARILGLVRLVQGADAEAERLHRMAGAPEGGLGVALAGIARHRADHDVIGTVVVPVYCMDDTIERALDSIAAAIRFLRNASGAPRAQVHICVVDDASTDDSAGRAMRWARRHPDHSVSVIMNNRNGGAGCARNLGAAAARGRYLWFLDADDWFLEPHLLLTATALDRAPEAGFARTAILFDRIDADVTPVWRTASENCYPGNLCVRRLCHDVIGGFPEEAPFHPATADDVAYSRALHSLFGGLKLTEKTVHYTMRDDNALARQRAEMTGGGHPKDRGPPDARFAAIEILTLRRLHALQAKRAELERDGWTGPPFRAWPEPEATSPDTATREVSLPPDRALETKRRSVALSPDDPLAWFGFGHAAHRSRHLPMALRAFRRAARLQADLAPALLNIATILFDEGSFDEAEAPLRAALVLRPEHANSLLLTGRICARLGRDAAAGIQLARAERLEPGRADIDAACAETRLRLGDATTALRHALRALAVEPALFEGLTAVAGALDRLHRSEEGLRAWDRAARLQPGQGSAFTGRSVGLLTRLWGPPPTPGPPAEPGRRLSSVRLGQLGRFGNQLLQYGALRLCAARAGLTLEVPDWPGRHLFDHDDPMPGSGPGSGLPRLTETEGEAAVTAVLRGEPAPEAIAKLADTDVAGYFCGDTTVLAPYRDAFRALFTPGRRLRPHADRVTTRLRAHGGTVVALHLRRGDFGWGRFWIAPEDWYVHWLESIWPLLDRPVLFIASDDPASLSRFARFRPLSATDLAEPIPGAEFFTDFHALCEADLVAVSNSSFSFVATMLNRKARAFHRPDPAARALVPYDPWSSPVLL